MVPKCQRCDFFTPPEHQVVGDENKSLRARPFAVLEGRREVLHALQLFGKHLQAASQRGRQMTSKMAAFSEKERLQITAMCRVPGSASSSRSNLFPPSVASL